MNTKKSYFLELEKKYGRLTLGGLIKSWRLSDEMSQTAFAKKLSLSVQNLNDIERGRRIPSPTRAAKIAKKLGVSEVILIQLAMRDSLYKEGFRFNVWLQSA